MHFRQGEGSGDRSRRQVRETCQGEGAGDRSGRQVREKEQETGQGEGAGDRSGRQVREKEQETHQSLAACLLHVRPVGVCQPVSHGHSGNRARAALQHHSGDRVYFNTTAVTGCTSTQ